MNAKITAWLVILACGLAPAADVRISSSGEKKLNNLVSVLLEASSLSKSAKPLTFSRSSDGWILVAANCRGKGTVSLTLDKQLSGGVAMLRDAEGSLRLEE